jgi:cardiolipin synthase
MAFSFPSLLRFLNLRSNFRNHRKIAVIDGKIGFVGGFNIGDEYLGKVRKWGSVKLLKLITTNSGGSC